MSNLINSNIELRRSSRLASKQELRQSKRKANSPVAQTPHTKRKRKSTANPLLIKTFIEAISFIKNHPDNKDIIDPINYHHIDTAIEKFKLNNVYYLDSSRMISMDDYLHHKDFNLMGSVNFNDPEKMKTSYIKFNPIKTPLNYLNYYKYHQNLYLFTVANQIVKIGGTKLSLSERFNGYQCGDDKCGRSQSSTNQKIHNTFYFYLLLGCPIKFYGMTLKSAKFLTNILDYEILVNTQVYHIYESVYIGDFKIQYNFFPPLSKLSDPKFNPIKTIKYKPGNRKLSQANYQTPVKQTASSTNNSMVTMNLASNMTYAPKRPTAKLNINRSEPIPLLELNNKASTDLEMDDENPLPKTYEEDEERGKTLKIFSI